MGDHVYVSETDIPFWASMFPRYVKPNEVIEGEYSGQPFEAYVYREIDSKNEFFDIRSIETDLNCDVDKNKNNGPKRYGRRLAYYGSMKTTSEAMRQLLPSALIFGRCFRAPPKYVSNEVAALDPEREIRNENVRQIHAERLQHLSGVKDMPRDVLRKILCCKRHYGYNFCNFVIHCAQVGLSVDILRLWIAKSIPQFSVDIFMRDVSYDPSAPLCIYCRLAPIASCKCVI